MSNKISAAKNEREAFLIVCAGAKGVGKTYKNMSIIKDYVTDNLQTKVLGRKCLIMDCNGEFTPEQFSKNNVKNFSVNKIAVQDVPKFTRSNIIEARRIDAKNLGIKEKLEVMKYCTQHFRNGLLVLEDINNYILSITHMEEIVGVIISARHRGLDILVSYQSLRPVEPRIWQNANWIRLHHVIDNVSDIKGKVPNPEILKIAQIIVDNKYNAGDKRFYLFINQYESKIEGNFNDNDFSDACMKYLNINKKLLKEYASMHGLKKMEDAYKGNIEILKKRYLN